MSAVHHKIAEKLEPLGGFLRCEECHHVVPLGDVGKRLGQGWPKHCGYTMRWWTQRQVDAGKHRPATKETP